MKFFFIETIVWGIPFGVWLGLYVGIVKGLLYGMAGGLVFAFIITATGTCYDYLLRRKIFVKYGQRSFDVIQTRNMFLKGDMVEIFQKSVSAMKSISRIKNVSSNMEKNEIIATTGITCSSFGEKIVVELFQEIGGIKVEVCSMPRLRTAMFDGGRSIENVEFFCSRLKSRYYE